MSIFSNNSEKVSTETLKLAIDELDTCNQYCKEHTCYSSNCKYDTYNKECFRYLIKDTCKYLTYNLCCDIGTILSNPGASLLYKLRKIIVDKIPETDTEKLDFKNADNETKAKYCYECLYTTTKDIIEQINLPDDAYTIFWAIDYALGKQHIDYPYVNYYNEEYIIKKIYEDLIEEEDIKNNKYTIEQLLLCIQAHSLATISEPRCNIKNCDFCEYNIYETLKDNNGILYPDSCLIYKFNDCLEEFKNIQDDEYYENKILFYLI